MSLHYSSSVNGEGSTPKDPLYKILDELRSLKLWKEKQERKVKGKKRVEEISQDEREKIREEETVTMSTILSLNYATNQYFYNTYQFQHSIVERKFCKIIHCSAY